jgi:hypothetical protein
MAPHVSNFFGGVIALGYVAIATFFLKFHIRTRDLLFLAFSAAFGLLALLSALVTLMKIPQEEQSPFFLLKLVAFLLIIVAIVSKNVRRNGR